jgi:hypothetical protein
MSKRVVYFVISVLAVWLMAHPPESFVTRGRWIWIGGVALVWALVMLAALVRATIASMDRNLAPGLTMTPVGDDQVPDALRPLAEQFVALGLARATPPLAIGATHATVLLGFVEDGGVVAGSAFSIRTARGTAHTAFDLFSRFEGDRGALTTGRTSAGAVLRPAPGALRQIFPAADLSTMLAKHREALAWLETEGVRARRLRASEFESLLRTALARQRSAFEAARVGYALTAIWRTITKANPHARPLRDQPHARAEITRLLGRR